MINAKDIIKAEDMIPKTSKGHWDMRAAIYKSTVMNFFQKLEEWLVESYGITHDEAKEIITTGCDYNLNDIYDVLDISGTLALKIMKEDTTDGKSK